MIAVIPVIDYGSVVAALRYVMFSMVKRPINCELPVYLSLNVTASSHYDLLRDAISLTRK